MQSALATERLSLLGSFSIRRAEIRDIRAISNCNIENLPENYDDEFYVNHLRKYPDLSLVAYNNENDELIGYALGKVDANRPGDVLFNVGYNDADNPAPAPSILGHITSVAVYKNYRNYGVGKSLMSKLHVEMKSTHCVESIRLHCRVSNTPAIKLYSNLFGYKFEKRISRYYADDEDAWLMCMQCTNNNN